MGFCPEIFTVKNRKRIKEKIRYILILGLYTIGHEK